MEQIEESTLHDGEVLVGLPIVKWPGGKRFLASEIAALAQSSNGTYFEPFAGGAAVFFEYAPQRAVLGDLNSELINFYIQLRDRADALITMLEGMNNSELEYYRVREWDPVDPIQSAARFYYLTKLSFNGIYRVNLKGKFNVPYGRKTHLSLVDPPRMKLASDALKSAVLRVGDFEQVVGGARYGDFVYLDPPYTVKHNQNGFVKYNEHIFSWNDQQRLASVATELADRGCTVVVSNADHETVRELYPTFEYKTITRKSVIAAKSTSRTEVQEVLLTRGIVR